MKNFKTYRKYIYAGLLLCLTWWIVRNDSALYQQSVGEVTASRSMKVATVTDEHGNLDRIHTQRLTIQFLNRTGWVTIDNEYTDSQSMTEYYRTGNQLLMTQRGGHWQILTLKRDAVLVTLLVLLMILLVTYLHWQKMLRLTLSIIINIGIFTGALVLDITVKNINVVLLFSLLALSLATVSLVMVLGRGLQAWITLGATVLATALAVAVMALVLMITDYQGVHFETMSYVTQVPITIFYAQTVIGVLGAVMDESSDIVAGLFGLYREPISHSWGDYWQAGRSVGRDILGTLINVLFMIFIAETIPMVVLMLRNGNNWPYILDQIMNLGILQSVVSALGIVLAVPVTSALAAGLLVKKGAKL